MFRIAKSRETESRLVLVRGWGQGQWGVNIICMSFFMSDENFLNLVVSSVHILKH